MTGRSSSREDIVDGVSRRRGDPPRTRARETREREREMRTHHRIERTAPIFSYEHVAVATTRDVCPLFTVTSTVASKGSRASATSTTLERSVNGSPGLTLSSTRTSSARMVINGGRGKIARSINAIDAAQFPCALATAPNIAGRDDARKFLVLSRKLRAPYLERCSSSSHRNVSSPIFPCVSGVATPLTKSMHCGSYACCNDRRGRAETHAAPSTPSAAAAPKNYTDPRRRLATRDRPIVRPRIRPRRKSARFVGHRSRNRRFARRRRRARGRRPIGAALTMTSLIVVICLV